MSFHSLKEKTDVSHFIEVMSPYERLCYDFSIQVEKAAEAFAVFHSFSFILFSRWNQLLILIVLIVP